MMNVVITAVTPQNHDSVQDPQSENDHVQD
jgi:hypothetical protein